LTRNEIARLLWLPTVPSQKIEQIKKHSKAILASYPALQSSVVVSSSPQIDKKKNEEEEEGEEEEEEEGHREDSAKLDDENNRFQEELDEFDSSQSSENHVFKRSKTEEVENNF